MNAYIPSLPTGIRFGGDSAWYNAEKFINCNTHIARIARRQGLCKNCSALQRERSGVNAYVASLPDALIHSYCTEESEKHFIITGNRNINRATLDRSTCVRRYIKGIQGQFPATDNDRTTN